MATSLSIIVNNAGQQGFDARLRDIPNYQDPDLPLDLKEKMDTLIATLNPGNISTINGFAREPIERLGQIGARIAAVVMDDDLSNSITNLDKAMADFDAGSFLESVRAVAGKAGRFVVKNPVTTAGSVLAAPFTWGGSLLALPLKGKFDQQSRAQRLASGKATVQDRIEQLRETIATTQDLKTNLESAEHKIPLAVQSIEELRKAALDGYLELALYLGAGQEVLRRWKEQEANGEHTQQSALDSFGSLAESIDDLDSRLLDVQSARAALLLVGEQATSFRRALREMAKKVQGHRSTSVHLWDFTAAMAGVAIMSGTVADVDDKAREHTAKVLQASAGMRRQVEALAQESAQEGLFDQSKLVKLLEDAQAVQAGISSAAQLADMRADARAKLEAAGQALASAAGSTQAALFVSGPVSQSRALPGPGGTEGQS